MPDLSGQSIGRYHIVAPLGEGGMATVYKAFDTRLERDVAIKFIRSGQIGSDHMEKMLKRFEREAKRMAKFIHSNIVPVMDYGEYEGSPYLVMPYLSGGTLKDLLVKRHGKALFYQEAARLLAPVARALEYAHRLETIHRDVKPANILITEGGQPMLADFGVAKILDLEEGQTLTGTGAGVGTPKYMAPEQWQNQIFPQTDIYALGVVFYELVTGRVPYDADTPAGVLTKQLTQPLPRPRQFVPELPEEVEQVIYKALAKEPHQRYADMGAYAAELEKLATFTPSSFNAASMRNETTLDYADAAPFNQPSAQSSSAKSAQSEKSAVQTSSPASVWDVPAPALSGKPAAAGASRGKPSFLQTAQPVKAKNKTARKNILWGSLVLVGLCLLVAAVALFQWLYTPYHGSSGTVIKTQVSEKDGMQQVYVPEGEFLMGSENGDSNEKPQHTVYLDAFWIDKTEVTNAMYQKCVAAGACQSPQDKSSFMHNDYYVNTQYASYPVINVDWNQASTYCKWSGGSLPTEAQWEKAARGTDGREYPWGNEEADCGRANYLGRSVFGFPLSCKGDTARVGSYPGGASPYGALDMAGNVFEWVNDWYAADYYANTPQKNPTGPDSGQYRVLRDDSWNYESRYLRSASRNGVDLNYIGGLNYGFRCVGF